MISKDNPSTRLLAINIDDQIELTNNKKVSSIIIDGGLGEGKTTLAVQIGDYIQGKPIILEEQLATGGTDFVKKMRLCFDKGHKVCIYDESGDFNKFGAVSFFNQILNRIFETFRAYRIIVILILPCFDYVDSSILIKQIPKLLINCYDRGKTTGNFRGYGLKKMFYLKNKMKTMIVRYKAYNYETPLFYGHFKDLPPERSQELERFSIKAKKNILDDSYFKLGGLVSMDDISKTLSKSKIWVRKTIKKGNLKPKEIYKKKYYYDKRIVEQLRNEIKK